MAEEQKAPAQPVDDVAAVAPPAGDVAADAPPADPAAEVPSADGGAAVDAAPAEEPQQPAGEEQRPAEGTEKAADGTEVGAEGGQDQGADDAPQVEDAPMDGDGAGAVQDGGEDDGYLGERTEGDDYGQEGDYQRDEDEDMNADYGHQEDGQEMKDEKDEGMKGEEDESKLTAKAEQEEEKPAPADDRVEQEVDAAEDNRPRLAPGKVVIGTATDSTLNVTPTCGGQVLMSLVDGGFQHLLAATRASVGIKAGRYLFEVRVLERRVLYESGKTSPKPQCMVGFSTGGSSLFIGDTIDSVGFESEGYFATGGEWSRRPLTSRFTPQTAVIGVLLNLDPSTPNKNTVSLFCNGERMCKAQSIPEAMHGKVLFPTVNFKNMSVQVNFGASPCTAMPFKCRMLADASLEDVEVADTTAAAKPEVLLPVSLPDEGSYEWLDGFLRENPRYTELSNRSVLQWGIKSGLVRSRRGGYETSVDKPDMNFGIKEFDEYQVQGMISTVAPMLPRDYVSMNVRKNLLAAERQKVLANFDSTVFKRVAVVVMGEPAEAFKAKAQMLALEEKRKRVGQEVRKQKEAEAKAKKEKKKPEPAEGDPTPAEEEEEDLEGAVLMAEEGCVLTEEEKRNSWFAAKDMEDMTKRDLGRHFSNFCLPTTAEGFDEVRYLWQDEAGAGDYMKTWVAERKLTQRVEDLQPGAFFKEKLSEWSAVLKEWVRSHGDRRDRSTRPGGDKRQRREDDAGAEDAAGGPEAEKQGETGAKDGEATEVTFDDLDPMCIEDINDVLNGKALFSHFAWEDWTMLSLRFELHLLVHAFRIDVNDADRPSFNESQLQYYYELYFAKRLSPKHFGVGTNLELLGLVRDTIEVSPKNSILDPQLSADAPFDIFVRLTEDTRRERRLRIDLGDETARLELQAERERGEHGSSHASGGYHSRDDNRDRRGGYQQRHDTSRGGYDSARRSSGAGYGGQQSTSGYKGSSGGSRGYTQQSKSYSGGGQGAPRGGPPPPAPPNSSSGGGYDRRGRDTRSSGSYNSGGRDSGRSGGLSAAPRGGPPPPRSTHSSSGGGGSRGSLPPQSSSYSASGGGSKRYPPQSSTGYSSSSQPYKQQRTGTGGGGGASSYASSRGAGGSYGGRR